VNKKIDKEFMTLVAIILGMAAVYMFGFKYPYIHSAMATIFLIAIVLGGIDSYSDVRGQERPDEYDPRDIL
jgi:hypothetical protein